MLLLWYQGMYQSGLPEVDPKVGHILPTFGMKGLSCRGPLATLEELVRKAWGPSRPNTSREGVVCHPSEGCNSWAQMSDVWEGGCLQNLHLAHHWVSTYVVFRTCMLISGSKQAWQAYSTGPLAQQAACPSDVCRVTICDG